MRVFGAVMATLILLTLGGFTVSALAAKRQAALKAALPTTPESLKVEGEELTQKRRAVSPDSLTTHPIPILMYHYIRAYNNQNDPIGIGLSVSPDTFRTQLQFFKNRGYQTMSLQDLADKKYPAKPLIITFDDGYADHFSEAFPILREVGYSATFFIVKNFVGRAGYMTREQINELKRAGMEIGAHSVSHKNLATASYAVMLKEIQDSLPNTDRVFAYPSGKYSPQTLALLNDFDVPVGVTTNLGIATEKSELLELPRLRIKETTDLAKLIADETYFLTHPRPTVTPTITPTPTVSPTTTP